MRFALFLFLLLSLSSITISHPWGDLSIRHRRGDDDAQAGTSKDSGNECFFAQKRKTTYEEEPRPAVSKVGAKCGGVMKSMNHYRDRKVSNLYQAPNYLALMYFRGTGDYSIDWNNKDQMEEFGNKMICAHHEAELGRNWENKHYYHFGRRERQNRRYDPHCSMPLPFWQHEPPEVLDKTVHYIEADEARAILIKRGVMIQPGLPVCDLHNTIAQQILAQVTVESKGFKIRPPPIQGDLSMSPVVTRDVNPYSDDRDENDPSFFPHHRESKPPIRREYIPPPKFPAGVKTAYAAFMNSIGLDASVAKKNWHELDERSQRRKVEGFTIASDAIAHFMAPEDPVAIKAKSCTATGSYERPRPKDHVDFMHHVKAVFDNAQSRAERIAALSIASHLPLSEIQKYIPGLSRYYLSDARKYSKRGYHLIKLSGRRMKFSKPKVDRALEFVTSYKISLYTPFGTREVKDSLGKWIEIPNVLRSLRVGEIYYLYKKELTENRELDLLIPETTFRKMLKICAAERRKSLHGVDIVIADAMEAFDRADLVIEKMLNNRWISKVWHDSLRSMMLAARQYLRTDFLIHGKEFSTTGDHCWSHGLSDPNDYDFQVDCRKEGSSWLHSHNRVCSQCENTQVWFGDMRATVEELKEQHKNDKKMSRDIALLDRDLHDWEAKIDKLKSHQLRTAKSENDRQWIVAGLKPGDVLLTVDWAMKAMPFHARESTADWYGQRGIPWHIGHALTFDQGEFWQHRFVHIFHGERQDSTAVTAIIRSIFLQLAAQHKQRIFLRCYKSSSTIASIKAIAEEVGIEVVGWYFSEAQAGKGPCDRDAGAIKRDVRAYADSGKSVTNANEFLAAAKHRIRPGYSFELVHLEGNGKGTEPKMSPTKIPDLSLYNAYTFEADALRVHRFWNIGQGKKISYKNFVPNEAYLDVEDFGGALSEDNFWDRLGEPRSKTHHHVSKHVEKSEDDVEEEEDEDTVCEKDKESKKCKEKRELTSALYRCPIEHCAKEFISEKNLQKHMTVGKHLRRPQIENILDYALHQYSSFLEAVHPPNICSAVDDALYSLTDDNENGVKKLMGWALPQKRRSKPFPKTVKDFLRKIYDEGARTGAKVDAREAEGMMRVATTKGGAMLFAMEDLLTSRQIAGVYSGFKKTTLDKREKVAQKNKKPKLDLDEEDSEEAEKEGEPMEVDEEEIDEVNALFDTEGDPELEYETEPLFDEEEAMRRAIMAEEQDVFGDEEEMET